MQRQLDGPGYVSQRTGALRPRTPPAEHSDHEPAGEAVAPVHHEAHEGCEPVRARGRPRSTSTPTKSSHLRSCRPGSSARSPPRRWRSPGRGEGASMSPWTPLTGSSNIATNNPLGSIFGFYSSGLPCSGRAPRRVGVRHLRPDADLHLHHRERASTPSSPWRAARATRSSSWRRTRQSPKSPRSMASGARGRTGSNPVERFVSSLEARGLKLRYGGTFVGDFNQVLRRGGIFGYPALKDKPHGKLRLLYEAAPMAFITKHAGGYASDGRARHTRGRSLCPRRDDAAVPGVCGPRAGGGVADSRP